MDTNNSQISNTASEPSISNAHNDASINPLISTDIVTTSQPSMNLIVGNMIPTEPLVISDQSRVEILMRHRQDRRRRRRRRREQRTEHQHQQLAQQIRRRHMANQQFQQQEYYRNHWFDERERQEHQDRDHNNNVGRQSSVINELFEEVIDEGLLELFDWDTIFSNDQPDQDPLYELEDIVAMEQPASVEEAVEQSQHNHLIDATAEEDHTILDRVENNSTTHSFDSRIKFSLLALHLAFSLSSNHSYRLVFFLFL
jgi:hypothetical protein